MNKFLITLALMIFFSSNINAQVQPSPTSERAELERKRQDIQKEIDQITKYLESTTKDKKKNLSQLNAIQQKLKLRNQVINNINREIDFIEGDINRSYNDIRKLRRELDTLKFQFEKSVVYAYQNRSNYDFMNFIFSATNFNDAIRRIAYLNSYRAYRAQQAENIKKTQETLEDKINSLKLNKNKKNETLTVQSKEKVVLEKEKKEKDVVVNDLKKKEKDFNTQIANKRDQARKLQNAITAIIRREIEDARKKEEARKLAEAKKNEGTNVTPTTPGATTDVAKTTPAKTERPSTFLEASPEALALSTSFESNKGRLPWPVDAGFVSAGFGIQQYKDLSKVTYDNPGLTFQTNVGGNVRAVFDGVVTYLYDLGGVELIIIRHGKYFTSYSNLASTSVTKGQSVKTGQIIGKAAANDDGYGEIDFQVLIETKNVNPEPWVRKR